MYDVSANTVEEYYVQQVQVNHQPYEEIIKLGEWYQNENLHSCRDQWMDPYVTCGYVYTGTAGRNGGQSQPIWDSQVAEIGKLIFYWETVINVGVLLFVYRKRKAR